MTKETIKNKKIINNKALLAKDPVFLSISTRNEYVKTIMSFAKVLSNNARIELIDSILFKQDIISLSNSKIEDKNDLTTKQKDRYLLKKIRPLLDKLDILGLDYLRIHVRDSIYNLGEELKVSSPRKTRQIL